jgi:hypothetical protein
MPANVRNFWVSGGADGNNPVGFGPKSAGGGITVRFQQRDKGSVTNALTVDGYAEANGTITLSVFGPDGSRIFQHVTAR